MIEETRKKLENLKGKTITIKVDVGRNKKEKYTGKIVNTYSKIWTFQTKNDIKSFTYSDIIIKMVKISP